MSDPSDTPRVPCPGGVGKKRACWAAQGRTHCRNHDPELAQQRRQNGAKRKNGPDVVIRRELAHRDVKPANGEQRPEWGPRKAEREAAKQASWEGDFLQKFDEPMPARTTARDEIQRALRAIMLTSTHVPSRVSAAKVLSEILPAGEGDGAGHGGGSLEDELSDEGAPAH